MQNYNCVLSLAQIALAASPPPPAPPFRARRPSKPARTRRAICSLFAPSGHAHMCACDGRCCPPGEKQADGVLYSENEQAHRACAHFLATERPTFGQMNRLIATNAAHVLAPARARPAPAPASQLLP